MDGRKRTGLSSITRALASRGRPLSLVLLGTVAAVLTGAATAQVPRSAASYYQTYNCESFVGRSTCNQTAGSWYTLNAVGATNWDVGNDICAAWGNDKGSTEACYTSGGVQTVLVCESGLYGYGWAGTYAGDNHNISGHEDNYTPCS